MRDAHMWNDLKPVWQRMVILLDKVQGKVGGFVNNDVSPVAVVMRLSSTRLSSGGPLHRSTII
jgi:hypothetical protein